MTRLRLLGLPSVVLGDRVLPLGTSRPMQLLAHLAVRAEWVGRDELTQLFWPDRDHRLARSNLRNLLHKTLAAAPWVPVEATEHALRLLAPSDLAQLAGAVQAADWDAVLALGAEDLLQGFEVDASEPYLRWLEAEREAALALWKRAVQVLLGQPQRPIEQRQAWAQAWGRRCPLDEDAVQAQVGLALERQQAGTAARLYHEFEARLQAEFGVRPSRNLERAALQPAGPAAPQGAAPGPVARPAPRSSAMVGRRLELQQLAGLLADPSARLVTLMGPGGVGKSTLLAALHEQCLGSGGAGVQLIDVSMAADPQAVVAAMGAALLGENLPGDRKEVALAAALRHRPCLVLLDGAEQAGLAGPLLHLLEHCAQLRLVVASRRRLQLDMEHLVALDGFPLPDAAEADPEVLAHNDAVRYLMHVMAQAGRRADLAHDAPQLLALVRAVDGLPLALRLLGQLTRLYGLQQLLDSVRQQLAGAHTPEFPDLGELLPALVVSFQRSWTALSGAEQAALARLAVFTAPFDITAARAVGEAALPVITSLVDASLLRAAGDGRLSMHAAVRACVLASQPGAQDRLGNYIGHYRERLAALAQRALSSSLRPLRDCLRDDGVHIEQAWRWAVEQRDFDSVLSFADSLWFINDGVASWINSQEMFAGAARELLPQPGLPARLRARLLACAALAAYHKGDHALARQQALEALHLLPRSAPPLALFQPLETLVRANAAERRLAEAKKFLARVMALRPPLGSERFFEAGRLQLQRALSFACADFRAFESFTDQALPIYEALEDWDSVARFRMGRAGGWAAEGNLPRAIQGMEDVAALVQARKANPALRVYALCDAAMWHLELGQPVPARHCTDRAVTYAFNGPQSQYMRTHVCLAQAALAVQVREPAQAAQALHEILAGLAAGEDMWISENVFLVAARWFLQIGDRAAGVALLRAIGPQPWEMRVWAQAQPLLRQLGEAALDQPDEATPLPTAAEKMEAAHQAIQCLLQWQAQGSRSAQPG